LPRLRTQLRRTAPHGFSYQPVCQTSARGPWDDAVHRREPQLDGEMRRSPLSPPPIPCVERVRITSSGGRDSVTQGPAASGSVFDSNQCAITTYEKYADFKRFSAGQVALSHCLRIAMSRRNTPDDHSTRSNRSPNRRRTSSGPATDTVIPATQTARPTFMPSTVPAPPKTTRSGSIIASIDKP
jgi:hypothetical protein